MTNPISELIKRIRSASELSQVDFGKLFEPSVTQSTIARWENGEQMPDRRQFPKIAYFADLTIEDLEKLVKNPEIELTNWEIKKKTLSPNKKHLTVFRRGVTAWNKWRNNNPDVIPELAGIELNTKDLNGINLSKADLTGAKFKNVAFNSSLFEDANLKGADLELVSFLSANLSNANFSNANLKYIKFDDSKLIKSSFYEAILNDVSFVFANLYRANFGNTKIVKSNFNQANCNEAVFDNAFICNCSVYGASFWECSFKETESENISISKEVIKDESNKFFEINNIKTAQSISLQRNDYNEFKNIVERFHQEEEIISISNILLEKYSSFRYDNKIYTFYCDLDSNKNKQLYENVTVAGNESNLAVRFRFSNFDINPEPYPTYRNIFKYILNIDIENNIIRSDFEFDDIKLLKNVLQVTEEMQIKRANEFVKIALKILEIQKKSEFIHECYFLSQENGEIVLCKNSKYKIELMRVNIVGDQREILRSNLSERCLTDFQKILLDLLM